MKWYYVENGQQAGPVDDAQLADLWQQGRLTADTLVWREGLAEWQPYRAVSPVESSGSGEAVPVPPATLRPVPAEEAVCIECGRVFNKSDMIPHGNVHICAGCKPVFMQKVAEGAQLNTGELRYAGFGIRFAAKFLDGLILGVLFLAPMMVVMFSRGVQQQPGEVDLFMIFFQLGFYGVNLAYTVFFLGRYGATPGKMICKLKVVKADGEPVSYLRALGRYFSELVSGMVCYIGYLMVLFDKEQRRALHDHMCSTRVVYK